MMEALYKTYQEASGVSIDSRNIEADALFFAIKGDRFDGHDFIEQVRQKGAKGAVIQDASKEIPGFTIRVSDVLGTLQNLARHHRRQLKIPVMGITGSNGKTTTKELLVSVLAKKYRIHATPGNLNNHIGVPLTILGAKPDCEFLLVEMGANHIGEIGQLSRIAEPDYGMITNIGTAHMEGFGSEEGILRGKTELYQWIAMRKGVLFYNPEDRKLVDSLPETTENIPYFSELERITGKAMKLRVRNNQTGRTFDTRLYGDYNFINIKAALSVGIYFGVSPDEAMAQVAGYEPRMNRSQLVEKKGITYIMDAYNANPSSVALALRSLSQMTDGRIKVAVLGDMYELGAHEARYHREIIDLARASDIQRVFLVGAKYITADEDHEFEHYQDVNALKENWAMIEKDLAGGICLLKGSRSMRLEELLQ